MKTHSQAFKEKISLLGKQQEIKITYQENNEEKVLTGEQINSASPHYEGNLLKSVMKELDLDSNVDIPPETEVNFQYGIAVVDKDLNYKEKEGNPITCENAINEKIRNLVVNGKSKQATRSGKNLFDASKIANSSIVVSDNGKTITMPIVSSGNGNTNTSSILSDLCPNLQVGDIIYVRFERNLNDNRNRFIYLYGSNKSLYGYDDSPSYTISQADLNSYVFLYGNDYDYGETQQVILTDFRIVKNATDEWEQYGASPSPEYPSEIHSVADDVNLLNLQDIENHSINYYYENIGTNFQLKAGETYTLSFDAESDITPFNVGIGCGSSGNYQSDILNKDGFQNGRISITFTPQNSNFTYGNYLAVRFVKYNNPTSYKYSAKNIKLQKGTVATPYSPYNQGTVTIKQRGKNEFKISNFQKKGWNIAIDNPLKGFNSGQYTISCVNAYKENIGIAIAFSNQPFDGIIGNYFTGYNFGNGTKYNNTQTITQEHINAEYMRLMPQDSGVTQEILENMQIQIEQRNTSNTIRTISNTTRLYYTNRTIKKST